MAPDTSTARSATPATRPVPSAPRDSAVDPARDLMQDRTAATRAIEGSPAPRHLRLIPGGRSERGITTAEYAVGTAAGAGLAGLLYAMLTGGLGERLIGTFFDHALSLLGVG